MQETGPWKNTSDRYHCAPNGGMWTLCGIRAIDIVWDDPYTWHHKETSARTSGSLPKCEACAASEDLPLHLLGDLP